MILISYAQAVISITVIWVMARLITAVINKRISIKRELQLLLVYICIIVIVRFVYFDFFRYNGKILPLSIGLEKDKFDWTSLKPFFFLVDRYDGWQINIIGNIAMFIPVGIVWPICFKELDTFKKTVLAGAGFSLLIEITQLFCYGRHTDIDDLILNTIGVAIGALIVFTIRNRR